jgi:putative toxin-antitoxin system antitoxin component (TIGR02293 family)
LKGGEYKKNLKNRQNRYTFVTNVLGMEEETKKSNNYPLQDKENDTHFTEEPLEAYISNHSPQNMIAWRVLGGRYFAGKMPESALDFYQVGESGISKWSVRNLAEVMGIPLTEMCDLLNISYKTLARKANEDLLDGWISSHSIEIAQTIARGLALFEDKNKLNRWLRKPNRALRGKIPLELLKYPTGIRLVNQIMERIEEGIYT